jgi:hypothetical protein
VLRGIIGLGEQQVIGVTKGGNAMALSAELDLRIRQDYAVLMGFKAEDVPKEGRVALYLGSYNESVVVVMAFNATQAIRGFTIDGKNYAYSSGTPIIVWNSGNFYSIQNAYDEGLLSIQDVYDIIIQCENKGLKIFS